MGLNSFLFQILHMVPARETEILFALKLPAVLELLPTPCYQISCPLSLAFQALLAISGPLFAINLATKRKIMVEVCWSFSSNAWFRFNYVPEFQNYPRGWS